MSPLTLPDPASLLRYELLALPWLLRRLQHTKKKHPTTTTTTRTQTSENVPVLSSDWKHPTSPFQRFGHRRRACDRPLNRFSQWQPSKWGNTFVGEPRSAETSKQSQRKRVSLPSLRWPPAFPSSHFQAEQHGHAEVKWATWSQVRRKTCRRESLSVGWGSLLWTLTNITEDVCETRRCQSVKTAEI